MLSENGPRDRFDPSRFVLNCRGREIDCRPYRDFGAHVMGVLNVTPDSFSDAGLYLDFGAAIAHIADMVREGTMIIDVGGESSRPAGSVYGEGAPAVAAAEETNRILPVVEAIAAEFPDVLISIDTYKPEVARAALAAGAHMINDVTGLRYTAETAAVAAEYGAALVVMHSLGKPGDPPRTRAYADLVSDVKESLAESIERAEAAGVSSIVVDPGFGFGKSPSENLMLVREVGSFLELNRPVMIGASRKSMIGAVLGKPGDPAPVGDRLFGSLGAAAAGVLRGASIVRTHDVRETVDAVRVIGAILNA